MFVSTLRASPLTDMSGSLSRHSPAQQGFTPGRVVRGFFHNESTTGDQPRFERGTEGIELEACAGATGQVNLACARLPYFGTALQTAGKREEGLESSGRVMTLDAGCAGLVHGRTVRPGSDSGALISRSAPPRVGGSVGNHSMEGNTA